VSNLGTFKRCLLKTDTAPKADIIFAVVDLMNILKWIKVVLRTVTVMDIVP
jgi:hypothetical protein